MLQKIKQLKNYYFPSPKYICESFWERKEIIFWRGHVCRTYVEFSPGGFMEMISLCYFNQSWKSEEVVSFTDFYSEKKIRSIVKDRQPKWIKRSAKLILEEYQKRYPKNA